MWTRKITSRMVFGRLLASLMLVAFPSLVDNGVSPSTHPIRLPTLYVEIEWNINDFADKWYNTSHPFVLSTGDPTGYGIHGGFLNGWDVKLLQQALNTCNTSSSVDDCPPLKNYTQSNSAQISCSLGSPCFLSTPDLRQSVSRTGLGNLGAIAGV